jgi:hypothetical protein
VTGGAPRGAAASRTQAHGTTATGGRGMSVAFEADSGRKPAQADLLVSLARDAFRLGLSTAGEPFAVPRGGPNVARMLRGGGVSLRADLARRFNEAHGRVPSSTALADAMLVIEGECQRASREPLALRVAASHGTIVLDLGTEDGACAVIEPRAWRIEATSPVLFRRSELTGALPRPEPGGDIAQLRRLLNVTDESWLLVLGWLVASLLPDIPHPILHLRGEQGSAKSTGARTLVSLVDPSAAPLRSIPGDLHNWQVAASGSWIVALDNITHIAGWLSDALCCAVTGGGLVKRRLYSDDGVVVLSYRRVLIVTAIDAGSLRGDLADRLLPVELERISEERRRLDGELEAAFAEMHPRLLGALLDLVARVIAEIGNVHVGRLPRMADFGRVLAALDRVRGTRSFDAYRDLGQSIAEDVVDGDIVASAITQLVADGAWRGTAQALLSAITPEGRVPAGWPSSPRACSGALRRVVPALRSTGVEVTFEPREPRTGRRLIGIKKGGAAPSPPSPPSPGASGEYAEVVTVAVTVAPGGDGGDGGGDGLLYSGDGGDGHPPPFLSSDDPDADLRARGGEVGDDGRASRWPPAMPVPERQALLDRLRVASDGQPTGTR